MALVLDSLIEGCLFLCRPWYLAFLGGIFQSVAKFTELF